MNYQGTWEHKARIAEMAKTAAEAAKQTAALEVEGKHHIGDFLPPEELSKFMNKMKVFLGETLQFLFDIGKRLLGTRFYSLIILFCLFIVSYLGLYFTCIQFVTEEHHKEIRTWLFILIFLIKSAKF